MPDPENPDAPENGYPPGHHRNPLAENDPADDTDLDLDRAKAKITKANNEARSLRERLKVAEEKAARLDELEDSGKSEMEKLTAKVAEAERKAQEAERRALVAEVAHTEGLTPSQAKRLVGNTLEELQADAADLKETFQPQEGNGGGKPPEGKPTPHLHGGGGDPNDEVVPDVKSVLDSIAPI